MRSVGQSPPILDSRSKAKGELTYITDREPGRAVHLALVLSDRPHARVVKIDDSGVTEPGYLKTFSCFNRPEVAINTAKWFAGQDGFEDQYLFPKTARYVGDPVAAAAARTKAGAVRAASRIKVEYQDLEPIIDPEEALGRPGYLHPGSILEPVEFIVGEEVERQAAFGQAAFVAEDLVVTPKLHHAAMENHAARAEPDGRGGVIVFSACQNLHAVHLIVARVTGLPLARVRVVKTHLGGSFGGKQDITFEHLAAVAALDLNRPVALELTRRQSILATRTRTKTLGRVRTAVDRDGLITGREMDLIVDTGAYTSNADVIARAMGKKTFRLYRIPAQRYTAEMVHTNTPVAGAMRGYGSPQIHAITEINLDQVAKKAGLDPCEFRLKNLVHPGDCDPSGGPDLGNARIIDCLRQGAEEFGWAERWARDPGRGRFRTGVGLACGTHGNGYFGAYPDFGTISLRMLIDGSVVLNACLHELGHGVVTIMAQIVAEVLEVPLGAISIPDPDTDLTPYDAGCQASRVTYVTGAAVMEVAGLLREMLVSQAASILGCQKELVIISEGRVRNRKKPEESYSYGEMAALIQAQNRVQLIQTLDYQARANPGSYAANFAAVEVDTLTGLVRVREVLAVHDLGRAINPGLVKGQILGGVQMGLGMALTEDLAVDPKTGIPKGDDFSRYHLINAPDMPPVEVMLIEAGEEHGPFGAKSVGELAAVPIVPAVVNAVNNALGTNLADLPLTPEKVVAAFHGDEVE